MFCYCYPRFWLDRLKFEDVLAQTKLDCFVQVALTVAFLRADVSKYRPEVYKSEKSKILKKIHKVALGKLLLRSNNYFPRAGGVIGFAALGPGFPGPRPCVTKKSF